MGIKHDYPLIEKLNPLRLFRKQTWIEIKQEIVTYAFYSNVLFELLTSFLFYYFIFTTSINTFVTTQETLKIFASQFNITYLPSTIALPVDVGYLVDPIAAGIALAILVITMAPLCGTHINPFITIGFILVRDFSIVKGIFYICVQLIASVCAAVLAPLPFSVASNMSGFPYDLSAVESVHPYPGIASGVVIIVEAILTFLFVFFLFMISFDPEDSTYLPQRSLRLKYSLTPAQEAQGVAAIIHLLDRQSNLRPRPSISSLPPSNQQETRSSQEGQVASDVVIESRSDSSINEYDDELLMTHITSYMEPHFYRLERSIDNSTRQIVQFLIGFSFGLVITLVVWAASSLTGGGFNAARVFGPALINNDWTDQYAYWVGGLIGCIIACLVYHFIYVKARRKNSSCASQRARELYWAHL